MTHTLLLSLLALTLSAQGQKDTTRPKFSDHIISTKKTDSLFTYDRKVPVSYDYIYIDPDGTLKVYGDTLKILRMIFTHADSIIKQDNEFVKIAVAFANTVPTYFKKNNKAWNKFLAEITKRGYRVSKKN
jgi:hypothetical protein